MTAAEKKKLKKEKAKLEEEQKMLTQREEQIQNKYDLLGTKFAEEIKNPIERASVLASNLLSNLNFTYPKLAEKALSTLVQYYVRKGKLSSSSYVSWNFLGKLLLAMKALNKLIKLNLSPCLIHKSKIILLKGGLIQLKKCLKNNSGQILKRKPNCSSFNHKRDNRQNRRIFLKEVSCRAQRRIH